MFSAELYKTYPQPALGVAQRLDADMAAVQRRLRAANSSAVKPCLYCGRVHAGSCVMPVYAPYFVMALDTTGKRLLGHPVTMSVVPVACYSEAESVREYMLGCPQQHNVRIISTMPYQQGRICKLRLLWRYLALNLYPVPGA